MLPLPDPNVNPLLTETGCHVATPRLAMKHGQLFQLFAPVDWSTHSPEWRPVPDYTDTGDDKPADENPPA